MSLNNQPFGYQLSNVSLTILGDTILGYFTKIYSVRFAGSGPKGENFLRKAISMFCYEKEKNFGLLSSSP